MRRFTSTFYSAMIIFGVCIAEVVVGHIEHGRFKAEYVSYVPRHLVSNASKCLDVLKDIKDIDWRLA